MNVGFPNLLFNYTANQRSTFPVIDTLAVTNSSFCLQGAKTYRLTKAIDGVSISPSGVITVDTRYPIKATSLAVVVADGYQDHTSAVFWIEVVEVIIVIPKEECVSYLATNITDTHYELQIGRENPVDLGRYVENGTRVHHLKAFFFMGEIQYGKVPKEQIVQPLSDVFIIRHTKYNKGQVELNFDLTYVNPSYEGATVTGNLTLMANYLDCPLYTDL